MPQLPSRPRFKWIAYVPLDAGPFYPPWEAMLRDMDEVIAMSDFGREVCSACTELVHGRGALVRPITKLTMETNLIEQAIIDAEDPSEQLAQLHQDPEKRQRYAVAGRAFASTLDWDALMPQWLDVVNWAAGTRSGVSAGGWDHRSPVPSLA